MHRTPESVVDWPTLPDTLTMNLAIGRSRVSESHGSRPSVLLLTWGSIYLGLRGNP